MIRPILLFAAFAVVFGTLAACDDAESRAERHYRSAIALLEAGDPDRAMVEFRNVFRLNGRHLEARRAYAELERGRGNLQSAYGHYLRLVEQYPEDLGGRTALAEMAMEQGNWEEVRRHAGAAAELAPEDMRVRGLVAALAYFEALRERDGPAREAAVTAARAVAETAPDLLPAQRVLVEEALRRQDWPAALAALDTAIAADPDSQELQRLRLGVLGQLGDTPAIEAQIAAMIARFPEATDLPLEMVRWYLSQGETDRAEAYLRARADIDAAGRETLVRFLAELRGPEAVRDELDRIIAADPEGAATFRAMRAGMDFQAGAREAAIAEMRAVIADEAPSDDRRARQVALARMLEAEGDRAGAQALIDAVLAEDTSQVEALKQRAEWQILADNPQGAVVTLRSALSEAPRDPQIMTLLARAHERAGNRELMAEMLSLAVEASGAAPAESLRYAAYLISEERWRPAEQVLTDALRQNPEDVRLVGTLGQVHVALADWPRLEQVVATLRRLGGPEATTFADELVARRLAAENREQDLVQFLEGLAAQEGGVGADAALIRLRLAQGDVEGARTRAEALLEGDPDNPNLRFIHASILIVERRFTEAREILRGLLEEFPRNELVWLALFNIEVRQGDDTGASAVLEEALEALPASLRLNWILASRLEWAGDIDGAIAVYEALYARDSNVPLVANNLASLLSMHRDDPATIERAWRIARRLRGIEVPAFQDTYGWLAFLQGEIDEALVHLEPAAAGLPEDANVQYHLARTYAALGRDAEALETYRRAEAVLGESRRAGLAGRIAAEIARLEAALAE